MDRLALSLVTSGLLLILAVLGAVITYGTAGVVAPFAAIGAAISGSAIVGGLTLLEHHSPSATRMRNGQPFHA